MSAMTTVYVLSARRVYDHGVIGVYAAEAEARAAAAAIWPRTDGAHSFVIKPRVIGTTYDGEFPTGNFGEYPVEGPWRVAHPPAEIEIEQGGLGVTP